MRLSQIKPYKKNAKKHDETQIKNVMQSIKEFGVVQPIVVDRNNTIIIGHCRYEAMKRLGYDELQEDWVMMNYRKIGLRLWICPMKKQRN